MFGQISEDYIRNFKDENKCDIFLVVSAIDRNLYENVVRNILNKKTDKLIVILCTGGGDPNYGYKIARLLQNTYKDGYTLACLNMCKSAGTLIACGAKEILMSKEYGEFGPLDVQISKVEDLESGLSISQFMQWTSANCINDFFQYFRNIKSTGVTSKTASEIATNMIRSIYEPICKQIDPITIGETERNLQIATRYAYNLNRVSCNIKQQQVIDFLVRGYPDHSFVIDYEEAKQNFFSRINEIDFKKYNNMVCAINSISTQYFLQPQHPAFINYYQYNDPKKGDKDGK